MRHSHKSIKDFLDAVDHVLNSNTFLFDYKPSFSEDLKGELAAFLQSTDFYGRMLQQDMERGRNNMHIFRQRDRKL